MLAIFGSGGYEWLVILIVALLLFGRRLPEVMRSMGRGVSEFKKGVHDVQDEIASAEEAGEPQELADGDSDSDSSSPAG